MNIMVDGPLDILLPMQSSKLVELVSSVYVLSGHWSHVVCPSSLWYSLSGHGWQVVLSIPKNPGSHATRNIY